MNRNYTIHNRQIKHKGYSTLEMVDVSYDKINEEGQIRKTFELFTSGDTTAALLYHPKEKCFYFVKQFRCAIIKNLDPWMLEVVAGGIDDGESPEEAIRREIQEETGHSISNLEFIKGFYVTPGRSTEYMYLYYAEVDEKLEKGGGVNEELEDLEIVTVPLKDLEEVLGNLHDAKSIIALQWFKEEKG